MDENDDALIIDLKDLKTGDEFEVDFNKLIGLLKDLYERPQVVLDSIYKHRLLIINLKRKAKEEYGEAKAEFDRFVGEKTKLYARKDSKGPLYTENIKVTNDTVENSVKALEGYQERYARKKNAKAYAGFLDDLNYVLAELLSFSKAIIIHNDIDKMDYEEKSEKKKEQVKEVVKDITKDKPEV